MTNKQRQNKLATLEGILSNGIEDGGLLFSFPPEAINYLKLLLPYLNSEGLELLLIELKKEVENKKDFNDFWTSMSN